MAAPYALDFSPLSEAIDANRQYGLARNKLAMEQERLGFERALHPGALEAQGLQIAQAKKINPLLVQEKEQGVASGQLDYERNLAQRFGGFGQAILKEPDPAKRQLYVDQITAHPQMKAMFDKALPPGWHTNPELVGHYTSTLAQGYEDPEKQALLRAETAAKQAEANKAGYMVGQPGTNVISIAPEKQSGRKVGDVIASQPLKPPPGYEPDPTRTGEYRPQIGGPADIKFTEKKQAAYTGLENATRRLDDLIADATSVLNHKGLGGNFGPQGKIFNYPGSESSNAWVKLEQLKAVGSLSVLSALKATGATLGAVSDAEGARLEKGFGALGSVQSLGSAQEELRKIIRHAQESKQALHSAYVRQYSPAQAAQTPTRDAPGQTSGTSNALPRVQNDAEYDALNSETKFIDPNGKVRIKP